MGTRITLGDERDRYAVVHALRDRGYRYRYVSDNVISTNASPKEIREIIQSMINDIPQSTYFGKGVYTGEMEFEDYPWYVNFTSGYNPPRRYSVPVPSLEIANAWERQFQSFTDRRRISVSKKPSRGANVLAPNTEKP